MVSGGLGYRLLLYAGCVLGIYAGTLAAPIVGLDRERFAAAALLLVPVGLTGARALYRFGTGLVAPGGAAVYGGLLSVLVVSCAVFPAAGLPFFRFWDVASISMLIGLIITKLGCRWNGCCGGRLSTGHGRFRLARYPARALEALWASVLAVIAVLLLPRRDFDGQILALTLAGYGAARIFLEQIRETSTARLAKTNLAISVLLLTAGAAMFAASGWLRLRQ